MSQFLRKKILGPHWFRGSCRLHIFYGPKILVSILGLSKEEL